MVGIGSIAQEAVLPAFQHAQNSELTALVSGDQAKREAIGKQYALSRTYTYEQFGECLASGNVDAVYIALPNHLHRQYAEAAARAGVHILCEKPLAQQSQLSLNVAGKLVKLPPKSLDLLFPFPHYQHLDFLFPSLGGSQVPVWTSGDFPASLCGLSNHFFTFP